MRLTAPSTRKSSSWNRRAPSPRRHARLERLGQHEDQPFDVLHARDRLDEMPFGRQRRDRQARDTASSTRPSAWSRRSSNPLPKRRASGRAGATGRLRRCAIRRFRGRRASLRLDAQCPERQRREEPPPPRPRRRSACHGPRAAAQAAPGVEAIAARTQKTLVEEARQEIVEQALLAAEEMRAAADVEKEPVLAIDRTSACSGPHQSRDSPRRRCSAADRLRRPRCRDAWPAHRRCPSPLELQRFRRFIESGDALGVRSLWLMTAAASAAAGRSATTEPRPGAKSFGGAGTETTGRESCGACPGRLCCRESASVFHPFELAGQGHAVLADDDADPGGPIERASARRVCGAGGGGGGNEETQRGARSARPRRHGEAETRGGH